MADKIFLKQSRLKFLEEQNEKNVNRITTLESMLYRSIQNVNKLKDENLMLKKMIRDSDRVITMTPEEVAELTKRLENM